MKEHNKKDVAQFVETAEKHMRDGGDLTWMTKRPFDSIFNTAGNLYRLGVLLNIARVGYHAVLDFGAGVCWLSSLLNKLGCVTVSLDVSETALKAGKALFESDPSHKLELNPVFIAYDGFSFPLENECVDRILCFDSFHHVPNPGDILKEMLRVLRPGGILAMTEPGIEHSKSAEAVNEMKTYGTLEQDIELEKLVKMAKGAGFSDARISLNTIPQVGVVSFDEYKSFMGHNESVFTDKVRGHVKYHTAVAFHKGPEVVDSRLPGILKARVELKDGPGKASPGEKIRHRMRVRNTGDTIWMMNTGGLGCVRLGAHLLDQAGNVAVWDFGRAVSAKDVQPGEEADFSIELVAPQKGNWKISFDMVDEGVSWFANANKDNKECVIDLDVL